MSCVSSRNESKSKTALITYSQEMRVTVKKCPRQIFRKSGSRSKAAWVTYVQEMRVKVKNCPGHIICSGNQGQDQKVYIQEVGVKVKRKWTGGVVLVAPLVSSMCIWWRELLTAAGNGSGFSLCYRWYSPPQDWPNAGFYAAIGYRFFYTLQFSSLFFLSSLHLMNPSIHLHFQIFEIWWM